MLRPALLVCLLFVCSIEAATYMSCKPYYLLPGSLLMQETKLNYCEADIPCACATGYINGTAFRATDCQTTLDTILTNYFDGQWDIKIDFPAVCKTSGCSNSSDLSISCSSGTTKCPSFDCSKGTSSATTAIISGFLLFLSYAMLQ
uniref:AAI domain-containing protein n=1 Tax=Panagrellus redivivus TaxID=6233 RepID=A0A7E4UXG2_PANRE